MANSNRVGALYLDSFGYGVLGKLTAQSLATTGTAQIKIPLLSGGLTNSGSTANSGGVIVRQVTVQNPTGSIASANIGITISSTGDMTSSNVVVANVVLSSVSAAGKYQDLTVAYPANTEITGNQTQALYVNVNTASGNSNTVDIVVYGQVVSF
ncbi:MAG: hypothetical protein EBZ96_10440 [Synechococcaceae bacterium WB9_3_282]|nr:hypothetical protein [Synechococcaceae bacterium WB9_3_282]